MERTLQLVYTYTYIPVNIYSLSHKGSFCLCHMYYSFLFLMILKYVLLLGYVKKNLKFDIQYKKHNQTICKMFFVVFRSQ